MITVLNHVMDVELGKVRLNTRMCKLVRIFNTVIEINLQGIIAISPHKYKGIQVPILGEYVASFYFAHSETEIDLYTRTINSLQKSDSPSSEP